MQRTVRSLIFSDAADDVKACLAALEVAGYKAFVQRVDRVDALLAALDAGPWECAVIDLDCGIEQTIPVLSLLRQKHPELPLAAMSKQDSMTLAQECFRAGANDFVLKKFLPRLGWLMEDLLRPKPAGTDRAVAQNADRYWEARFRALTEKSSDAIVLRDARGKMLYASASTERILGYAPEELIGQYAIKLVHPDDVAATQALMEKVVGAPGQSLQSTVRVRHKDGAWRWMEGVATNMLEDPAVGAIVLNYRDVTDRKRVEASLQTSQAFYRTLFEQAPVGVVHATLGGDLVKANQRFCVMLGYDEAELAKLSFHKLTHPDDLEEDLASLQDMLTGKINVFRREKRYLHKNGLAVWASLTLTLLHDEHGEPDHFIAVIEDISERKHMQEKLRESEEHYRSLIHTSPDGIALSDPSGRLLFASPRLYEIFDVPQDRAVLGQSVLDWVVPEGRAAAGQAFIDLLAKKQPGLPQEFRLLRSDQSRFWGEISSTPLLDSRGEVKGMMSICRDITARKEAEVRLAEQAALLDSANDAIIVRDLEHRYTYWNKAAERLYGWSAEEVLRQNLVDMFYGDREQWDAANQHVLTHGDWTGEVRQFTKDRKEIIVLGRWTLLRDEQGHPKSILVINTDITERKRLEARFLRAQRLESIGQLAGGIAHDLNNILAPIVMVSSLLREQLQTPELLPWLDTLDASARRGASIVKQILTFSRGVKAEKKPLPPAPLLQEIEHLVRETFPKNIHLKMSYPRDLWAVNGDPTQLHQVFMNLCVNARDAMPEGGALTIMAENVLVDAEFAQRIPHARPGPHVSFLVADNGIGIPPELLDRIFDPFFTTKEFGQGTGLGLSTTLGIVRDHSGFLWVESTPGAGTQFRVYLPARDVSSELASASTAPVPRGRGECVLVVDDEENIRRVTQRALEQHGYRTLTASDGTEAIILMAQKRSEIQVVLTDLMMPQLDGVALLRALRHLAVDAKLIATTGLDSGSQVSALSKLGVQALLRKPYSPDVLLRTLREVLDAGAVLSAPAA